MNIYYNRIKEIRDIMQQRCLDVYMVFSGDYHGSEYVSEHFKFRDHLSGFTGSAGTLLITEEEALLWTDGRYFLQAEAQLSGSGIRLMRSGMPEVPEIREYLKDNLSTGDTIGFDGRTVALSYIRELADYLADCGCNFDSTVYLADELWEDRPPLAVRPIWILGEKYTGKSTERKLADIRERMKDEQCGTHIVTTLDDIAWILNLRGNDVEYNPVFMANLVITVDNAYLYAFEEAVDDAVRAYLEQNNVELRKYGDFLNDLESGIAAGRSALIDDSTISVAVFESLPSDVRTVEKMAPSVLMKAKKNETEMENIRRAHIKDGAALTKLIYSLKKDENLTSLSELDVEDKLLSLRKQQEGFLDESFASIIATGKNGAIIHYEPDETSNARIEDNTFLLMDTGGHYLEGTTDVTRTIAVGEVTLEMKRLYTAVLKGNLRLANAVVKKSDGSNIDILARTPLWELGYDYRHGTGHGVGYLLNVHEGPQNIRMKKTCGSECVDFAVGMLTSDEPGVYLDGQYGIRLENLMLTVPSHTTEYGDFLKFETVTMAPYDRSCILTDEMTTEDLALLRGYYKKVRDTLLPLLSEEEGAWLIRETDI